MLDRLKAQWTHLWQRVFGAPEPALAPPLASEIPAEAQQDPLRGPGKFDPRYPVS